MFILSTFYSQPFGLSLSLHTISPVHQKFALEGTVGATQSSQPLLKIRNVMPLAILVQAGLEDKRGARAYRIPLSLPDCSLCSRGYPVCGIEG